MGPSSGYQPLNFLNFSQRGISNEQNAKNDVDYQRFGRKKYIEMRINFQCVNFIIANRFNCYEIINLFTCMYFGVYKKNEPIIC